MTMPHLMNCPHQGEGWCLDCVKQLWEESQSWETEVKIPKLKILKALITIIDNAIEEYDRCGCCETDNNLLDIFTEDEFNALTQDYWKYTARNPPSDDPEDEAEENILMVGPEFINHILNCVDIKVHDRFVG